MKTKNILRLLISCAGISLITACTNLDEELFGRLSPETYYQNEDEALSSVVGVYQQLSYMHSAGGEGWRIGEFDTDEFFVPGRASGGWYSDGNMELMSHKLTPTNECVERAWNSVFTIIGAANAVMESLEQSPMVDQFSGLIAETRALRAYGYLYAMDFWGNVPVFTEARVDANNLPKTNPRSEVYDFVVTEFLAAVKDLPSITKVNKTKYYPRLTKEAVFTALATVYLNSEVYVGTANYDKVIAMCDSVIKTNAYELEDRVGDCFLSTNEHNSTEVISSFAIDPTKGVGGNQFMLYVQHALDKERYNLPFSPANGYCFTDDALNWYDDPNDERLSLLQYGPQYHLDGVTPLKDSNGVQLNLVTLQSMNAALDNEGYRVLKYSPIGAAWSGSDSDNDYIAERYANVLLMKAEALFRRSEQPDVALGLVNQIRTRSGLTEWTDLTLKKIELERAREFIWENQRRRDMIRFGSFFTDTWFYKTTETEQWRSLFPIPAIQLSGNPNLEQNPGYTK